MRRKSGKNKLSRKLKAILADTLLVRNLSNDDYMQILLKGRKTLEERFADIEIVQVREALQDDSKLKKKYPKRMQRLFKVPDLPRILCRKK